MPSSPADKCLVGLVGNNLVQLVLVLMHVVGRVGQGSEGDGEGGEVGGEVAGQEGGGDPERPRHHRSRRESQPLQFRLLQTFRFRSSVLEPDLHLKKIAINNFLMSARRLCKAC